MNDILNLLKALNSEMDFSTHTAMISDGVLDSFDIISIIAAIWDEFAIAVPPQEITPENFNSAAAIHAMVKRLLEE